MTPSELRDLAAWHRGYAGHLMNRLTITTDPNRRLAIGERRARHDLWAFAIEMHSDRMEDLAGPSRPTR